MDNERGRSIAATVGLVGVWVVVLPAVAGTVRMGVWWVFSVVRVAVVLLLAMARGRWRGLRLCAGAGTGALLVITWSAMSGNLPMWTISFSDTVLIVRDVVVRGYPPLELTGPVSDLVLLAILLGVTGTAAVYTFARAPLAAGALGALVALVPPAILTGRLSAWTLVGIGVSLAILVWSNAPRFSRASLTATVTALAVTALVMAVIPPSRDRVWNTAILAAPLGVTVPDVTVALANDLVQQSDLVAFTFSTSDPGPYRFTLATLADFSGGRWEPQDEPNGLGMSVEDKRDPTLLHTEELYPAGFSGATYSITVQGLVSSWLPLPQQTMSVQGGNIPLDEWKWTDAASTTQSSLSIRAGDEYQANGMMWVAVGSTRATLEQGYYFDQELYPEGSAVPAELQSYLELPADMPEALHQTAQDVAGWASDRVYVGLALQSYFRSGQFTYDLSVPYTPGDDAGDPYAIMESLLSEKSGFCVHYASTFAVMARSLGVPTRLAVGYAGNADGTEGNKVRGKQLHVWPEIYLDEVGWLAFEPTPGGPGSEEEGRSSSIIGGDIVTEEPTSSEAEPSPSTEESTAARPAPSASAQPGDGGTPEKTPGKGSGGSIDGALLLRVVAALVCLAAVALLPAGVRRAKRRVRLTLIGRGSSPGQRAWDEFSDTVADLDAPRGRLRARTPEALVEALLAAGALTNEGADAAWRLTELVAAERFGGHQSSEDVASLLEVAIAALRENTGVNTWRARVLPRSLFRRA